MTTVAFIGLGIMGGPMAANLVKAGFDVVGYNRSPQKIDNLVKAGGRGASSVSEAVKDAEIIITMLPDSPDVEEVALAKDGILANAKPNSLYIDMSTIKPSTAMEIAKQAQEKGFGVLDAPVSGGEQGAIDANLSIMVGGSASDFEKAKPIFEAVGSTIVHVGPSGSGQTVKAANQLIVSGTIELVAEAIVFLEAYGVDTESAVKVLAGGLAGNRILDRKASSMLARQFKPGFRVELHHKDLGILTESARQAQVIIPLGALVSELMASLKANGNGDLDHSALLLGVERLCGRDK